MNLSKPTSFVLNHLRPRRRTKPGTRPGTIAVDPQAPRPRIHVIDYDEHHFEQRELDDLHSLQIDAKKSHVTWINVDGLGDAETISTLGKIFNLHSLALEDVVNTHQRAKVEEYDQRLFIVCRMITLTERVQTEQLSIFLGANFVLTFQERVGDCFDPVRERLRTSSGRIRTLGADYLAYALIDAVIDGYYPVLEEFGERIEQLEEKIYRHHKKLSVVSIMHVKRDLMVLRRAIWPHREMIARLTRDALPLISDKTRLFLRDCYDHAIHLVDLTETYREMVADLRDLYMSALSNRANEIMKVLTLMATIFIPLTFIAGIYGMNFDPRTSPWNMPELKWYYGYPFALGLMGMTLLTSMLYYAWRGWIRLDRNVLTFRRRRRDDDHL